MKTLLSLFVSFIILTQLVNAQTGGVSISGTNSEPDPSAMLDIQSTEKGMLVPRMTSAQRLAIVNPASSLLVYDTDTETFWFNQGTSVAPLWIEMKMNNGVWNTDGSNIFPSNLTNNVGIGTNNPQSKLVIQADANALDTDTLLVVKNKSGKAVFAIFNNNVEVYVDSKNLSQNKGFTVKESGALIKQPIFTVTPDSTVFYVSETAKANGKGLIVKRIGSTTKGLSTDVLLQLTSLNTTFYLSNDTRSKGLTVKRVGSTTKGSELDLFNITSDSTTIATTNQDKKVKIKNPDLNNPLLNVDGGVKVANSANNSEGVIKYTGEQFEGNVTAGQGTFIMSFGSPTLADVSLSDMTRTSIAAKSNVTDDGGGYIFAKGFCWNTTGMPTRKNPRILTGDDDGEIVDTITNLTCATTYFLRAFAINATVASYSNEVSFLPTFLPTVTNYNITEMTSSTVTSGGNVTDDGCLPITARGVCWNTTGNPTIADSHTTDGVGIGGFTSIMTGLIGGTTYYYRAYATNSKGTGYSNDKTFLLGAVDYDGNVYNTVIIGTQMWMSENLKTAHYRNGDPIPYAASDAQWTGYAQYGWYNNDINNKPTLGALYSNPAVVDNRKICPIGWHIPSFEEWATLVNALGGTSVAGGKLKEAGLAHWNSPNTGATNESGFSAFSSGSRSYSGGASSGLGTQANFWSNTVGGTGYCTANLISLSNDAITTTPYLTQFCGYGFSVRCVNDEATTSGAIISTNPVMNLAVTTATCGGNVTSDGGLTVTERGVCWSTDPNPTTANNKTTNGTGSGTFTSLLTDLTAGTTYYIRAYAINSASTTYGNEISFTTQISAQVTDFDGNIYNTVTIGTQTWMKENLKTTHYANGDAIPYNSVLGTWTSLITGAYTWYSFDYPSKGSVYGALYNGYSVIDSRNVCPTGWHVSTDADWTTLTSYLGGVTVAGGKMKETGITHWASPNTGATNESGFSALPGGQRFSSADNFTYINQLGEFWTPNNTYWKLHENSEAATRTSYTNGWGGCSVRCVKD